MASGGVPNIARVSALVGSRADFWAGGIYSRRVDRIRLGGVCCPGDVRNLSISHSSIKGVDPFNRESGRIWGGHGKCAGPHCW